MTKYLRYVAVLVSLAFVSSARADLGETEQQIKKRFGKPSRVVENQSPNFPPRNQIGPAEKIVEFTTRDFTAYVLLFNGKSAYEQFKFATDIVGPNDPRVKQILDRQAKGPGWSLFPKPELIGEDVRFLWARFGDGEAADTATASVRKTIPNALTLTTHEFQLLQNEAQGRGK